MADGGTRPETADGGGRDGRDVARETGQVGLRDAFYALGLVTMAIAVLGLAAEQLAPVALAVLIWFLVNALANGLRRVPVLHWVLPQWLALTLATLVTVAALTLAVRLVIANAAELGSGLQNLDVKLAQTLAQIEASLDVSFGVDVPAWLSSLRVQAVMGGVAGTVATTVNYVLLVVTFVVFLLLDQPFYDAKIRALFPEASKTARVRAVLDRIGRDTRVYIWIMTVVSLVVGFATWGAALWFGLKGAAFWGFVAFALNFIPTIGPIVAVAAPVLFAFVQFDSLETLAFFAGVLTVVQFVMANIVLPQLTGDRLNLSQFVVILSLVIWGSLWGVSGLFLAVPLMMVLAIVLSQFESTRAVAILMSQNGKVASDAR